MNTNQIIDEGLKNIIQLYPLVHTIAQALHKQGAKVLLVGGAVRDMFLQFPLKDLDIEVHDISLNELEQTLKHYGPVSEIGKAFGVLRLHGLAIDWSVPRTDQEGRKPKVDFDAHMDIKKAFMRRDLTINAMGVNILTHELIDPFGGLEDVKKGILRAPDAALFVEDPLRFFRIMQFLARFQMQPDKQLNDICKTMNIADISRERIEQEFEKLLLKSVRPSLGIRWLDNIGRLKEVLPELYATKKTLQNLTWHPEGNVFEHSMQTLDAAAALSYQNDHERLIMLYTALCHDLGKVNTTKEIKGVLRSFGHEKTGAPLAKTLLMRITHDKELIEIVTKLIRFHMYPFLLVKGKAKLSTYKRIAAQLAPNVTLRMLGLLGIADKQGRNGKGTTPLTEIPEGIDIFFQCAEKAGVTEHAEKPILLGKDLLGIIEPGPKMGVLLKKAYQLQIDKNIKDKEQLKEFVLSLVRS